MTTTLTEGPHTGEFILSEANGQLSREEVTIESGQDLSAGHVLGEASSGEYKEYDPNNADGSQTAVAVLYDNVDATGGAQPAAVVRRNAEVDSNRLVWFTGASQSQKDTGAADLASNDIIVR